MLVPTLINRFICEREQAVKGENNSKMNLDTFYTFLAMVAPRRSSSRLVRFHSPSRDFLTAGRSIAYINVYERLAFSVTKQSLRQFIQLTV